MYWLGLSSTIYLIIGIFSHIFWTQEFKELGLEPSTFLDKLHEIFLWPIGWYHFFKAVW